MTEQKKLPGRTFLCCTLVFVAPLVLVCCCCSLPFFFSRGLFLSGFPLRPRDLFFCSLFALGSLVPLCFLVFVRFLRPLCGPRLASVCLRRFLLSWVTRCICILSPSSNARITGCSLWASSSVSSITSFACFASDSDAALRSSLRCRRRDNRGGVFAS